jgi:ubiquinone/menaquinone biosynthesis C-methylase UbiE
LKKKLEKKQKYVIRMKTYYDDIADGYEELHKEEQLRKLRIIKEHLRFDRSDLMLDVGCGPGFASEILDCRLVGLDPSKELLKRCSFKTICCEAEEIPYPDKYFDVVISVTSIHNFNDVEAGLLEMKRVGKERFAFSILKKTGNSEKIRTLIEKIFSVKKVIKDEQDLIIIAKSF